MLPAGAVVLCKPLPDELLEFDDLPELGDVLAADLPDPPELALLLICVVA